MRINCKTRVSRARVCVDLCLNATIDCSNSSSIANATWRGVADLRCAPRKVDTRHAQNVLQACTDSRLRTFRVAHKVVQQNCVCWRV